MRFIAISLAAAMAATLTPALVHAQAVPGAVDIPASSVQTIPVIIYNPTISPLVHYIAPTLPAAITGLSPGNEDEAAAMASLQNKIVPSAAARFQNADPAAKHVLHTRNFQANPVFTNLMKANTGPS